MRNSANNDKSFLNRVSSIFRNGTEYIRDSFNLGESSVNTTENSTFERVKKSVQDGYRYVREKSSEKLTAVGDTIEGVIKSQEGKPSLIKRLGNSLSGGVDSISKRINTFKKINYFYDKFNNFDTWAKENAQSFYDSMNENIKKCTSDDNISIFDRLLAGIKCIFNFICFVFTKIISMITGAINGSYKPVSSDVSSEATTGGVVEEPATAKTATAETPVEKAVVQNVAAPEAAPSAATDIAKNSQGVAEEPVTANTGEKSQDTSAATEAVTAETSVEKAVASSAAAPAVQSVAKKLSSGAEPVVQVVVQALAEAPTVLKEAAVAVEKLSNRVVAEAPAVLKGLAEKTGSVVTDVVNSNPVKYMNGVFNGTVEDARRKSAALFAVLPRFSLLNNDSVVGGLNSSKSGATPDADVVNKKVM